MDILRILGVLWRRRLLVGIGALAAVVLCVLPVGRSAPSGQALSRVLVDTPTSLLADVGARGSSTAAMRASLLADLMASDQAKAAIARGARLPAGELVIHSPSGDPPLVANPLAERASIATAAATARYALSIRPDPRVPIISISAFAPDSRSAAKLAESATASLAATARGPAGKRSVIALRPLGPVDASEVAGPSSQMRNRILVLVAFLFWCGVLVVAAGVVRWWRALGFHTATQAPAPRATPAASLAFAVSIVASDVRRAWQYVSNPAVIALPRRLAAAAATRGAATPDGGSARLPGMSVPPAVLALVLAAVVVVAALSTLLSFSGGAPTAARSRPATAATAATFKQVFDHARAGATIALAPGDYGTFTGGSKAGTVTIRPQAGADVTMALDFDGADHIRVDGVTLTSLELKGDVHDVTVANSRLTGPALIRADEMAGAGIVLDHNTHAGIGKCDGCFEGRLTVTGDSGKPSGIVVRRSTFGPGGESDGILNGGHGVQILDNRFVDLKGGSVDGVHVDAIQLYGSRGTVIRGNRLENVATGIMAPDGTDHELIERNVIDTGEYPYAILLGGDVGTVIRSNWLVDGSCAFEKHCGTLVVGPDKAGRPSRGTRVEDNILSAIDLAGGSQLAANLRNTFTAATDESGSPATGAPAPAPPAAPSGAPAPRG